MNHVWLIEEDVDGNGSWCCIVDQGPFCTKGEARAVLRDVRLDAHPDFDGPYRLAKYVPEGVNGLRGEGKGKKARVEG